MGNRIEISTPDGKFMAYQARAAATDAPTVVVIQEAFGVNRDLQATCDELATQGFHAVSPDLYWRQVPNLDLSPETEWERGIALYQALDLDKAVQDVRATVDHVRTASRSGRVGVMGFCLGGLLTYLSAVRGGVDAGVWFYGARTEEFLAESDALRGPLLMHMGSRDEFIPPDAQAAIQRCLVPLGAEVHVYEGCYHAFARHQGRHFDAAAASLAMTRTLNFLRAHLDG